MPPGPELLDPAGFNELGLESDRARGTERKLDGERERENLARFYTDVTHKTVTEMIRGDVHRCLSLGRSCRVVLE